MSENSRSRLAIFTSILTLIGIIVLTQFYEIGLTIVFLAILLLAGYFVRRRLQALGAEAFALGSVFTWLGFFTMSFPVLAFAWNILEFNTQLIFFIVGIFLIIFGFSFEAFDLNIRFVKLLRTLRLNLSEAWENIRRTIFRSPWSLLAIVMFTLALVTFFVTSLRDLIPNLLGFDLGVPLEFLVAGAFFVIIEFRHPVLIILKSAASSLKLMLIALLGRLRRLPSFLRDVWRLLQRWLIGLFRVLGRIGRYLTSNLFISGLIAAIGFGYFGLKQDDIILQSAALIFLLIAMINVLVSRQEAIAHRVANIQQSAYRRSFTLRNLVRSKYTGNCPSCNTPAVPGRQYCQNCGIYIPDCLVCRNAIYAGQEVLTCPHCEIAGHADHVERWLAIRPTCPNCRERWE